MIITQRDTLSLVDLYEGRYKLMKKMIVRSLACVMAAAMLAGCGGQGKDSSTESTAAAESRASDDAVKETGEDRDGAEGTDALDGDKAAEGTKDGTEGASPAKDTGDGDVDGADGADTDENGAQEGTAVRVGSLKGPTSMGLVFMMEMAESGKTADPYSFTMVTAADELLPKVLSGDIDIALVPANVASTLYNKTEGQVAVIDINTLGVLYGISSDDSIKTMADLKGKTVYTTGKGTTPEHVLRYLLAANGLSEQDVTLEFKSEPTEVAALLAQQPEGIGILPQPFVTVATAQNDALKIVLDLTKEWEAAQTETGSRMVTGVTLVRRAFLEEHPEAVVAFLEEHEKSASYVKEQPDRAAELVVKTGIIEKAPVAKAALPYCNITCITGEEMAAALKGYLDVLYEQEPQSVGGAVPGDDFYYLGR